MLKECGNIACMLKYNQFSVTCQTLKLSVISNKQFGSKLN